MAKRFTDSNKWRNEWFRTLSLKSKLAWVFLCDECESHGIIKMDYGLASFQLGFSIDPNTLAEWFGDKIYFLNDENILIVQFFEFQYGESKDSWSAKVRAKEKLEQLGFTFENNKLVIPSLADQTTVGTQSEECGTTRLIRVKGRVSNVLINKNEKKFKNQIQDIYKNYPRKIGWSKGLERLLVQIKTEGDASALASSVKRYRDHCVAEKTESKFIMHFSTFANCWRDWSNDDAGTSDIASEKFEDKYKGVFNANV